jgi:hypothetical protein
VERQHGLGPQKGRSRGSDPAGPVRMSECDPRRMLWRRGVPERVRTGW